ncbi:MAG: VOC family protein [Oscillospiraceae bacterium]
MKFKNPLLAVTDMEKSVAFYKEVLGLRKIMDFGANVTLTGGVCLQTRETWAEFIGVSPDELGCCGKVSELYFEEDDFDSFLEKLTGLDLRYIHPVKEHAWGQRVVRFYDPDGHIIEVGENTKAVCLRFLDSGMTEEQTAERMDVPLKFVKACMKGKH